MKKLLTVSLLAMMAVGTARADIASTDYADRVAANAQSAAITAAATDATNKANTAETNAKSAASAALAAAKAELEGKITAETTRATNAETALGARIDDISAGELTIKENAVTAFEIKDGEVKTNEIANDAVTTAKIANDAVTTVKIANDAVTTVKILDKNVTKDKLSEAVQTSLGKADSAMQSIAAGSVTKAMLDTTVQGSLDKADLAAPQSTTYTKTEVDTAVAGAKKAGTDAQSDLNTFKTNVSSTYATKTEISDMQVKDNIVTENETLGEDVDKDTVYPSFARTDSMVTGAVREINNTIDTLETQISGVSDSMATAVTNLQSKDTEIAGDIDNLETNKVSKTELGIDATFNIPDKCKAQDAVCSLVVRAGVADWEVVQP